MQACHAPARRRDGRPVIGSPTNRPMLRTMLRTTATGTSWPWWIPPNGSVVAVYEYDPFGNMLRETVDPLALQTLGGGGFRFSTKYHDQESGLLYYGYRHLNPDTGRWLNRDPIGEGGGENPQAVAGNDLANHIDSLGERIVSHVGVSCCRPADIEYSGRLRVGTTAFAEALRDALQAGVEGRVPGSTKHVQCLVLSVGKPEGGSGPYYRIIPLDYQRGPDYDTAVCKSCRNVERLEALLSSRKEIRVYNTDFNGRNSALRRYSDTARPL